MDEKSQFDCSVCEYSGQLTEAQIAEHKESCRDVRYRRGSRALPVRENPLFVVAADTWKQEVLSYQKRGTEKGLGAVADSLVKHFGHFRIQSIDYKHIQKYIAKCNAHLSPVSILQQIRILRRIIQWSDPDWVMPRRVVLPRRRRKLQKIYSLEEMRTLIKTPYAGRDKRFIMVMAETGCREGEALALKGKDVKNGTLTIERNVYQGWVQDTPKTDSAVRVISITPELEAALKAEPEAYIFRTITGRPDNPQNVGRRLKELCAKIGVEYKPSHAFRRGNITALIKTLRIPEKVVGMRVGHLSEGMTLGVYCQVEAGDDKQYVGQIRELFYGGDG